MTSDSAKAASNLMTKIEKLANNANHKETNFWLEKVRRFPQELEDHCIAAASGQLPPKSKDQAPACELRSKANAFVRETTRPSQSGGNQPSLTGRGSTGRPVGLE